jgi:hypothetical protein
MYAQVKQLLSSFVEREIASDSGTFEEYHLEDLLERIDEEVDSLIASGHNCVFLSYTSLWLRYDDAGAMYIHCDYENAEEWVRGIGDGHGNEPY